MTLLPEEKRALSWALSHKEEFADDPVTLAFLQKIEKRTKNT